MNIRWILCALCIAMTGHAIAQTTSRAATAAPPTPVVQMSAIKVRTGSRISRFTDAGAREFAVNYNPQGRVSSVTATLKRHIADVLSIGYDDNGRIIGVLLGSGKQLYYSYAKDGTRVIRDGGGNIVTSSSSGAILSTTDTTGSLSATVSRMDALLKTLGQ